MNRNLHPRRRIPAPGLRHRRGRGASRLAALSAAGDWLGHHARWIWLPPAGLLGLAALWASRSAMDGAPRTVVQVTTDAIAFRPDTIIDLVNLARPQPGTEYPAGHEGIRLDPPQRTDTFLPRLGFAPRPGDPPRVLSVQRLQVQPTCEVGIEPVPGGSFEIRVQSIPDSFCWISAEMLLGPAAGKYTGRFKQDTVLGSGKAARLQMSARRPLRSSSFAVSRLGFTTNEAGSPRSAMRGGTIVLPDHGARRDTVHAGVRLGLGDLQGDLTTGLGTDGNGISALFKGKASEPAIGTRTLKPTLLQHAYYKEDLRLVLTIVVGFIGLTMAILQVVVAKRQ